MRWRSFALPLALLAALIGSAACGPKADEMDPEKDKTALERFDQASDGAADTGGGGGTRK